MKKELILIAGLTLAGCTIPAESKAYYEPFADRIVYQGEGTPEPSTIAHEKEHQKRANEYVYGRFAWGLNYIFNPSFACDEEVAANAAAEIEPSNDHPSCEGVIFKHE